MRLLWCVVLATLVCSSAACSRRARAPQPANPLSFDAALLHPLATVPAAADTDSVLTRKGNASVACGKDAVVYLAWTVAAGDSVNLLLARSADLGNHMSEAARINDVAGKVATAESGEMRPEILLDRDGAIDALWTDRRSGGDTPRDLDVYFARSDDGGASFLPSVRVDDGPDSTSQAFASMALDDAGGLWAVWLDSRLATPEDFFRRDVRAAHSPDGGRTFFPSVGVASLAHGVSESCRPAVAARGNDVLVLFRNNVEGVRDIALARSRDGGATFDSTLSLAGEQWHTDDPGDGPRVEMLAGRRFAVVWSSGAEGASAVRFLAASLDDSAFGSPLTFEPRRPDAEQMHPVIFARDSLVVICWEETAGGATDLALSLSKDNGRSFSAPLALDSPETSENRGPGIALAGRTHVLFIWSVADGLGDVRLARALLESAAVPS